MSESFHGGSGHMGSGRRVIGCSITIYKLKRYIAVY